MKAVRILAIVLLACGFAFGQHEQKPQATLTSGLGDVHHPVTTSSPEAQKFFDQGLALIYAFNHDEARRSFERAAELDSKMAMAYWGIAVAVGPNYNLPVDAEREKIAYDNVQKALSLGASASEPERAYIQALAKRYTDAPNPQYQQLAVAYKDAMREVSKRFPDDLDAGTLYAESIMNLHPWGLWNKDGTPVEGTQDILATLESVLRRDPNHLGAVHYYIHAVEASNQPERALAGANKLASLAPAAGHLVHMPAHIYIRTGDYAAARRTNEEAAKVDEAYIQATKAQGIYPAMYYSHNLHFIAVAAAMEGRYGEAKAAADKLAAHVAPMLEMMPPLEAFAMVPTTVLLRFERWNDVLQLPQPDPKWQHSVTMWHFARGMALASTGKPDEAEKEHRLVAEAAVATPLDAIWSMPFNNRAKNILKIADGVLAAKVALARRDDAKAIALLNNAIQVEDSLNYGEPPDWYSPVRELLGRVLLAKGDYEHAEQAFRADLQQHPRNGRSLYGLAQVLKVQGRTHDEFFVRQQFESAWKDADTKLEGTEVAEAGGGK